MEKVSERNGDIVIDIDEEYVFVGQLEREV